ncbi:molybdenum cofactor biosynthesis protein MoaE [bacterium]|nr:molybdenum cofactor biosynthesis protein MoaE [bacterium]
MVEITDRKIDVEAIIQKVSSPKAGAISTFIGTTRNYTGEKQVVYLFYEAYESMALAKMEEICQRAVLEFDIEKIAIVHRIGKVGLEEASVVIAVSAGHRQAAFNACQYAIDTLKEIVPIWKKEYMTDGSQEWIANN